MSLNPAPQYYVRVRGRVQGPFELSRLKVLRARGQFSRVFEVSEDAQTWVSSETLSGLIDPAPVPPAFLEEPATGRSHPSASDPLWPPMDQGWEDWEPRRRKKSDSNLGTILLIVMLVIVPTGIIGGIVLLQRLDRDRAAPAGKSSANVEGEGDRSAATFQYWSDFLDARNNLISADDAEDDKVAAVLRSVSHAMAALPTLGVDREAIQLVIDYSAVLTQLATTIETSNDPVTFLEAIVRGADGDPFGKVLELKSSQDAAVREWADVEQRLVRVRASLTAVHGRQFP